MPYYENVNLTGYKLGKMMYPEIFMSLNDKYMATLL
jgi:hypothetical protein